MPAVCSPPLRHVLIGAKQSLDAATTGQPHLETRAFATSLIPPTHFTQVSAFTCRM